MWELFSVKPEGSDLGKVYYLTVQESSVEAGQSQRRPGLHVDRPGQLKIRPESAWAGLSRGRGCNHSYVGHGWGRGCAHMAGIVQGEEHLVTYGGIYMASSVNNSSKVWNCGAAEKVIGRCEGPVLLCPAVSRPLIQTGRYRAHEELLTGWWPSAGAAPALLDHWHVGEERRGRQQWRHPATDSSSDWSPRKSPSGTEITPLQTHWGSSQTQLSREWWWGTSSPRRGWRWWRWIRLSDRGVIIYPTDFCRVASCPFIQLQQIRQDNKTIILRQTGRTKHHYHPLNTSG